MLGVIGGIRQHDQRNLAVAPGDHNGRVLGARCAKYPDFASPCERTCNKPAQEQARCRPSSNSAPQTVRCESVFPITVTTGRPRQFSFSPSAVAKSRLRHDNAESVAGPRCKDSMVDPEWARLRTLTSRPVTQTIEDEAVMAPPRPRRKQVPSLARTSPIDRVCVECGLPWHAPAPRCSSRLAFGTILYALSASLVSASGAMELCQQYKDGCSASPCCARIALASLGL